MIVLPVGGHIEGYSAIAVDFDGTDRMARGAGLTGAADAKVGIFSTWVMFQAGDGNAMTFFGAPGGSGLNIERQATNIFRVVGWIAGSGNVLIMAGSTAVTADSTWHHIAMSWDLGNALGHVSLDGVDDVAGGATLTDQNIDYTTSDAHLMSNSSAGQIVDAFVSEYYLNLAEYLDITVPANLQKLRLATGKPADPGSDGSTVTGSAPTIMHNNPVASWHTNTGGGGGMTLTGTLAAASSSPSD